jgi:hypothetical protein
MFNHSSVEENQFFAANLKCNRRAIFVAREPELIYYFDN